MKKDLTQGPVTASMLIFAGPMILGNLLQQCYNIADTLIVGRFLGPEALAAVVSLGTRVLLAYMTASLPAVGVLGIWWAVPIGWILADAVGLYAVRKSNNNK